jgi:hypothetical protein
MCFDKSSEFIVFSADLTLSFWHPEKFTDSENRRKSAISTFWTYVVFLERKPFYAGFQDQGGAGMESRRRLHLTDKNALFEM